MGYLHIPNLYKDQTIRLFQRCWALEKIHGTSAHIKWNPETKKITFFSGGSSHEEFCALFDAQYLQERFEEAFLYKTVIYGEAYGGKMQGMSATYGKKLKFVAFDVNIGDLWLGVPQAQEIVERLGLEFVSCDQIETSIVALDAARDLPSVQAVRNGILEPKPREGVVLRPLLEMRKNNGERVISKHKGEAFQETKTKREVDPSKLQVLAEAQAIADEWATPMRLRHVLDKLPEVTGIEAMPIVIKAMLEDILREAEGEIVDSHEARKSIGSLTAKLYKHYLHERLANEQANS